MYSPEIGDIFYTTGFISSIYTFAEVTGGKPMKSIGTWVLCL